MPAGGGLHDLAIGPGPASAASVYVYIYGVPAGYAPVFETITALVEVESVTRVDPSDARFMIAPSLGTAFMLAYLSARPSRKRPFVSSSNVTRSRTSRPAANSDLPVTSGGRQRTARVHVPASYDPKKPTPVVLSFHGRLSNPSQRGLVSKATARADAIGFVVVDPAGVGQT